MILFLYTVNANKLVRNVYFSIIFKLNNPTQDDPRMFTQYDLTLSGTFKMNIK